MSPRRAPLAVALLVVLAGCVGAGVSPPNADQSANETAATTSPGGTPPTENGGGNASAATATASGATDASGETTISEQNATTPEANATLPPGVNESGVEDAEALVVAHRNALNDTSFAFRFRANVSVGPAVQWTNQWGQVEPGFAPLVVHSTSLRRFEGDATRVGTDLWANETAVVVKYRGEDTTELRRSNRTGGDGGGVGAYDESWAHLPRADLESQVTQSWLVELALAVGDYRLAGTERRDGHLLATLRADEPVAAANYTDLNATLVVDGTGLVHSASLTATAAGVDDTRIHYEFSVTDLGATSVVQPDWVEAATPPNRTVGNATTATTATTDGGSGENATTTTSG